MQYAMEYPLASRAVESERAAFIRRTYAHLAGAILAFVGLETILFQSLSNEQFGRLLAPLVAHPGTWLVLLLAFIGVGYLARYWARSDTSPAVQYTGLALYVVAEAIIFVPILFVAIRLTNPQIVTQAAILTLCMFGGLTASVFVTRKDFSFLGPILSIASFLMLGVIICACFSLFNIGLLVGFFAVALACGFILYDTSNVLHHFRTDQHVAASLDLFASVAYLFYNILFILLQLYGGSRD